FQRVRFLAYRYGQGAEADGATAKFYNHAFEDALVHFIKTVLVDFEHGQGFVGDIRCDSAFMSDLSIVAHTPEQIVGNPWRAAAAPGDLTRALTVDFHAQ